MAVPGNSPLYDLDRQLSDAFMFGARFKPGAGWRTIIPIYKEKQSLPLHIPTLTFASEAVPE